MSEPTTAIAQPPSCKIDWYSFTIPLPHPLEGAGRENMEVINRGLQSVFPPVLDPLDDDGTWSLAQAKGFYEYRATHLSSRIAVSWGSVNNHLFVELPGEACTWARLQSVFLPLVQATHSRASRVDAAIDLSTDVTPEFFIQAGHAVRFSESVGNIKSKTGDTCYVGSRKSERSARVYRYAAPHPRSQFLRVEAEFKGFAAKSLAGILALLGEVEACRTAHAVFEWKHGEMDISFLMYPSLPADQATSPVTANIDGLWTRYCLPVGGINQPAWWTYELGLLRYLSRRWKRRGH